MFAGRARGDVIVCGDATPPQQAKTRVAGAPDWLECPEVDGGARKGVEGDRREA